MGGWQLEVYLFLQLLQLFLMPVRLDLYSLQDFAEALEVDVVVEEGHFRWQDQSRLHIFLF